jgi:transcriptional regulator with XRE-family HTH domain
MTEHIGAKLRSAREAAGVSLSAMARLTNYSRYHLSNVEAGRRRATADVVLAYERALGDDDPSRHTLLTGLPSGVVAPMVMAEVLHRAFTQALTVRPPAEEWWTRTEAYGRDYMTLGAAELSARLVKDMVLLAQQVDEDAVWAPAARLMTVYGKTLPAYSGGAGAVQWYRLAAELADRSADLPTQVWVRARAALALAYEAAELPCARALARKALALAGDPPSLGRLTAVVALAHAAGAEGDAGTAVELMERAERELAQVGSHDQISDFAVPEWRFWTFASMLYSRLGDQSRASHAQESADRARPATLPRFATHIELHRGLMLARAGDRAGGIVHARAALARLPAAKRSRSLRLMMAEIERGGRSAHAVSRRPPGGPPG